MPLGTRAQRGCVLSTSGGWQDSFRELNLGTDLWEKPVCDSYESKKLKENNWNELNKNKQLSLSCSFHSFCFPAPSPRFFFALKLSRKMAGMRFLL